MDILEETSNFPFRGRTEASENLYKNVLKFGTKKRFLTSCSPGFKFQIQNQCFFLFLIELRCEKDIKTKKRPG